MKKNTKNDYTGWLVIIGVVVLLLEILFFNSGLIFSLLFSGGLIYYGRKKAGRKSGKWLFIAGIVSLVISVFSMMTFRFLLLAILLHLIIQYYQTRKNPNKISLNIKEAADQVPQEETIIKSKPLFENILFGQQKTPVGVYEWNDINIQSGIGDTMIDLSYTVLPKGETVIFIRNVFGNIHIQVPYEIEVSVQHSCIVGSTTVFENHQSQVFNQVFQLKTGGYDQAEQKVRIFTNMIVGNLEVSRI
jgi:lia operon protein LiaF